MTIENDRSGTITTSGAGIRNGPNGLSREDDKVETAKAESAEIAETAKQAGKEVMSEVGEQTTAVARTAKDQFGQLATQTRQELKAQSEQRGEQLAARLQTWAGQMKALVEGRVEDAGELRGLIGDAQQRLESYASSLRERGPGRRDAGRQGVRPPPPRNVPARRRSDRLRDRQDRQGGRHVGLAERRPVRGGGRRPGRVADAVTDRSMTDRDHVTEPLQPDKSLGELFSELTSDLGQLFRQEVQLAKTEAREEIKQVGKGAGMLAGAGLSAWLALVMLSLALAWCARQGARQGGVVPARRPAVGGDRQQSWRSSASSRRHGSGRFPKPFKHSRRMRNGSKHRRAEA